MPVQVTRNFVVKVGDQTIVLSPEEIQKAVETEVVVTCSGPRCQARNARPEPFSVSWKEEEAAKNPLALPDAFYQMIKLTADPVKPSELVFCGRQCTMDYLQYTYVPPQPPRIALENAKREQAQKLEELNPHLVPGDHKADDIAGNTSVVGKSDYIEGVKNRFGEVVRKTDSPSPVSQADGEAGE